MIEFFFKSNIPLLVKFFVTVQTVMGYHYQIDNFSSYLEVLMTSHHFAK